MARYRLAPLMIEPSDETSRVSDAAWRFADGTEGLRPSRPDSMPEKVWLLTARCWAQDPKLRPRFSTIVREIEGMYSPRESLRQQSTQTSEFSVVIHLVELMSASTDSTDNETAWATASEGDSSQDQQ